MLVIAWICGFVLGLLVATAFYRPRVALLLLDRDRWRDAWKGEEGPQMRDLRQSRKRAS